MIKCMGSTGRMTVVLPHGALFRKELKVKLSLRKRFVEAVIGLGSNIFTEPISRQCFFKQKKIKVNKEKYCL
jgi:type I restriction enzyme M protein